MPGPRLAGAGTAVHAGDAVRIEGSRFPKGSPVRFSLGSATRRYPLGQADPDGSSRVVLRAAIAGNVPLGPATLSATTTVRTVGEPTATATVRVLRHVPTLLEAAWPYAAGPVAVLLALGVTLLLLLLLLSRRRRRALKRSHDGRAAGTPA